jgi:6-phosphofructokinase
MIVEVMGRDAGWLALRAGLASGADVILIPEIPFDLHKVDEKIEQRDRAGRKFSIIVVVAEGAKPIGGKQAYQESKDPLAPKRLGDEERNQVFCRLNQVNCCFSSILEHPKMLHQAKNLVSDAKCRVMRSGEPDPGRVEGGAAPRQDLHRPDRARL